MFPAGELVHAYAKRVLGTRRRWVRSLEQGKAGRVRLGPSLAFEQGLLDEVVRPLLASHC